VPTVHGQCAEVENLCPHKGDGVTALRGLGPRGCSASTDN